MMITMKIQNLFMQVAIAKLTLSVQNVKGVITNDKYSTNRCSQYMPKDSWK